MLENPIFVGFTILNLSKLLMYDFYYGYIKTKYGNYAQLCFSDTDSLLYDAKCNEIYRDMSLDANMFDFSDYPANHLLFNTTNKKVETQIYTRCTLNSKHFMIFRFLLR